MGLSRNIPAEDGQAWRITAEVEAAKKLKGTPTVKGEKVWTAAQARRFMNRHSN